MIRCMLLCAAAKVHTIYGGINREFRMVFIWHRCSRISLSWKVDVVKLDRICESYVCHCDDSEHCLVVYVPYD